MRTSSSLRMTQQKKIIVRVTVERDMILDSAVPIPDQNFMTLFDRRGAMLALCLLTIGVAPISTAALQEDAPTLHRGQARSTASAKRSGSTPESQENTSNLETKSARSESGPQKADDEGRTRLPMPVRKSVSFREIGPAISGGRVPAVVGVPAIPISTMLAQRMAACSAPTTAA